MEKKIWNEKEVKELFDLPFLELILQALTLHKRNFKMDEIEFCTLLSIKTGGCSEDCAYCPQSAHYKTKVQKEPILSLLEVTKQAKLAKKSGSKRLCIGAAWRSLHKKDMPIIFEMIKIIKQAGLESCATLGMINEEQAKYLKEAGLDYYNHNLDTSPDYYKKIITTRSYQERIDTLKNVSDAGIKVCSGGIIGMGEEQIDRINLLIELANLETPPTSLPINKLMKIKGTPLENAKEIENIEFVKTIAVARIMLPSSVIRLSAGRIDLSEETQILCFLAGANSIWLGDRLLTASNPSSDQDFLMFSKLGIKNAI